jgi:primosomal protein N' (replication factor Y)
MARRKISQTYVNVAVLAALPRPLTYRVPDSLELHAGQRVEVPLGTRRAVGVVLERASGPPAGVVARDLIRALESEPALPTELVKLGLWISDYYLAPVGEVFRAMLPLRPEKQRARVVELTPAGRRRLRELESSLLSEARESEEGVLLALVESKNVIPLESVRRKFPVAFPAALAQGLLTTRTVQRERGRRKVFAVRLGASLPERPARWSPTARRIVEALETRGAVSDHRELLRDARTTLDRLKRLEIEGWIVLEESGEPRLEFAVEGSAPELTPAQQRALDELQDVTRSGKFETAVLHGITGSGKTEIYLRLVARCLQFGRAALILVPEIALTPGVEAHILARFGAAAAVLHSGLTENERHDAWLRIRRGEARVVLGTRSAVFAPVENLGLIVVDEEHDSSYKQDETPRYHGRDVAVVRARLARALVVLGSATPSLESSWNAREGKYRLLTLPERVAGRPLARVEIVDMRQEFRETHTQVPISRRLREEIEVQLQRGAQTMILLNRRGYSRFLLCRACGATRRCENCSISLTYHRREHRLICHYCGFAAPVPPRCPDCGSEHLQFVGEGTEKLETKLAEMFPAARVARLDRDVAQRAALYRRILSDFRDGKINILVGTQLISKGHDFPGVTLVGVVSADAGLALPDFRAAERTFQLLTQAAGRAGRGSEPGRVLVQTFYPDHYAIRFAAEQNYDEFYLKELRFRRMMHYPPLAALANIVVQDEKLEHAARVAHQVGEILEREAGRLAEIKILGPTPAPLARLKRRFRIQFLLKSSTRARLHTVLRRLAGECERQSIPPPAVTIDVDPVSVM